jgi:hypothetical protein
VADRLVRRANDFHDVWFEPPVPWGSLDDDDTGNMAACTEGDGAIADAQQTVIADADAVGGGSASTT